MKSLILFITLVIMLVCDGVDYWDEMYMIFTTQSVVICEHKLSDSDVILLARLVNAEAGMESLEGKWAVADVVVYISEYKNKSIYDVIYDEGRFDGINSKIFNRIPPQSCISVAKNSLSGMHVLPRGVMFFHNPDISTDTRWVNYISKFKYKKIGNHLFCYHPDYYRNLFG